MSNIAGEGNHGDEEQNKVEIGARVQFKSMSIGTVRYVGRLSASEEEEGQQQQQDQAASNDAIYVGIEWDEASRGKHSGTYNGVHYFKTIIPNSASFIKQTNKNLNFGISLSQAARIRYQDSIDKLYKQSEITINGMKCDIVGDDDDNKVNSDKNENIKDIRVLNVSNMGVSIIDISNFLSNKEDVIMYTNLKNLSINKCLLRYVYQVLQILKCFPSLKILDASNNVFEDDDNNKCVDMDIYNHNLEELILNNCNVSWKNILVICSRIQSLNQLRLHNCKLISFKHENINKDHILKYFKDVTLLDLDNNELHWDDIEILSKLSKLYSLYISSNNLNDLDGFSLMNNDVFQSLHTLCINSNNVNGWKFITWLNNIPALRSIRLSSNPIEKTLSVKLYMLKIIARLKNIVQLDGSFISEDERLQAERLYLREEILPLICLKSNKKDAMEELNELVSSGLHPRAMELHDEFSDIVQTFNNNGNSNNPYLQHNGNKSFEMNVISVKIRIHDKRIQAKRQNVMRVLPLSISKERLYVVIRNLLRIDSGHKPFNLFVTNSDGSDEKKHLMDDGMTLHDIVSVEDRAFNSSVVVECL